MCSSCACFTTEWMPADTSSDPIDPGISASISPWITRETAGHVKGCLPDPCPQQQACGYSPSFKGLASDKPYTTAVHRMNYSGIGFTRISEIYPGDCDRHWSAINGPWLAKRC